VLANARYDDGIESIQKFVGLVKNSIGLKDVARNERAMYAAVEKVETIPGVYASKGGLTWVWFTCEKERCDRFTDN
jgi:hypothetical protein